MVHERDPDPDVSNRPEPQNPETWNIPSLIIGAGIVVPSLRSTASIFCDVVTVSSLNLATVGNKLTNSLDKVLKLSSFLLLSAS